MLDGRPLPPVLENDSQEKWPSSHAKSPAYRGTPCRFDPMKNPIKPSS